MKKGVLVEARAEVALTIVNACHEATVEVIQEETKEEVDHPPDTPAPVTQPGKAGKKSHAQAVVNSTAKFIQYSAASLTYIVVYRDEDQLVRRSQRGLSTKGNESKGRAMPPEERNELMNEAFRRAKDLWNELDKSDLPCFIVD